MTRIECSTATTAFIQLLRRLGRVVLLGDTPIPTKQFLGPGVVSNSIAILGNHGYMMPERTTDFTPWTAETMSGLFFDYLMQGKMKVSVMVTSRYSPSQAPEVYLGLLKNRTKDVGVIYDGKTL